MNDLQFNINKDKILIISFNNKKKNSFSPETSLNLIKSFDKEFKGVIFKSTHPGFFCSGGDLKYYNTLIAKQPGVQANLIIKNNLNLLFELSVPTVAVVDGLCVGGGMELLSAFDHVISSPRSLFSFWQRKIGLTLGWGGGERLLHRVSKATIKKLLLSSEPLCPYQALNYKLVDTIVPHYKTMDKALNWMSGKVASPYQPVELFKKRSYFNKEQEAFVDLWLGEAHQEALNRFNKN